MELLKAPNEMVYICAVGVNIRQSPSVQSTGVGGLSCGARIYGVPFVMPGGLPWLRISPEAARPYLGKVAHHENNSMPWKKNAHRETSHKASEEEIHCAQCGHVVASHNSHFENSQYNDESGTATNLGHFCCVRGVKSIGKWMPQDSTSQRRKALCGNCNKQIGWHCESSSQKFWALIWHTLREGHPPDAFWALIDASKYSSPDKQLGVQLELDCKDVNLTIAREAHSPETAHLKRILHQPLVHACMCSTDRTADADALLVNCLVKLEAVASNQSATCEPQANHQRTTSKTRQVADICSPRQRDTNHTLPPSEQLNNKPSATHQRMTAKLQTGATRANGATKKSAPDGSSGIRLQNISSTEVVVLQSVKQALTCDGFEVEESYVNRKNDGWPVSFRRNPTVNSQPVGGLPYGEKIRGLCFIMPGGIPWLRVSQESARPWLGKHTGGTNPRPWKGGFREDDNRRDFADAIHCAMCGNIVALHRGNFKNSKHENQSGIIFGLGHFCCVQGADAVGSSAMEDAASWFPGCWRRKVLCAHCRVHIGWHYDSTTAPFWGLIWHALKEGHPPDSLWLLIDATKYREANQPQLVCDLDDVWPSADAADQSTTLSRQQRRILHQPCVHTCNCAAAAMDPCTPDKNHEIQNTHNDAAGGSYSLSLQSYFPQQVVAAVRKMYATSSWYLDGSDGVELKPPQFLTQQGTCRMENPIRALAACGCPANIVRPHFLSFCIEQIDLHISRCRPLVYVTLGSGKLYHDWEAVEELLRCGYEFSAVHAVDESYGTCEEEAQGTSCALRAFAGWLQVEGIQLRVYSNVDAVASAIGCTANIVMQCDAVLQSARLTSIMEPGGINLYMTQGSGRFLEMWLKPNLRGKQTGVRTSAVLPDAGDPVHANLEGLVLLKRQLGSKQSRTVQQPIMGRHQRLRAQRREQALRVGTLFRVMLGGFPPPECPEGMLAVCKSPCDDSTATRLLAFYSIGDEIVLDVSTEMTDDTRMTWAKLAAQQLEGSICAKPGWVCLRHESQHYLCSIAGKPMTAWVGDTISGYVA
eukprot:TRINITY_DN22180_c0_g1_i1.p1 TRINITY_DN22180_c0_g1~~TRINITY_DN22180_c0_g1_i1.p1  ORF type:complete len:1042 (-),score=155.39 TRINITY_DN22180_c0_g1_i1:419-3544(-)